ncbi:hypothetical protein LTR36_005929 [Oleoguttula mirabilis]|uniref:Sucrose transporter n=1 Tax=Oleoguttula mirabilis TaxID=1507867 RepID=A0AAV9JE55_9PEZI|nr:hypothetical protein LTR36_005929 [Oleoguttula mirabilis]
MEDPPSPPPPAGSSPSRCGSHLDSRLHDTQPHPKHVQFQREVRLSISLPNSRQSTDQKGNGDFRRGKSIDLIKGEDGRLHEASPLLGPRMSADIGHLPPLQHVLSPGSDVSEWNPDEEMGQETKSTWYLFLLTLGIGGLQIAWSVELSNGSPYLLGLGISKSMLAFVWIAGPLSGTLVQPYVGIKSDRCRSRFGKRRPFMVGGAIATIISLIALAWTREIVSGIGRIFGATSDSHGVVITSIVFAVLMIYVLDFSINVIQAGIRAFIVDNAPTHQQDSANAWASRMSGVGNIIGYMFGYIDLPRYLWFFGNTQFKVLCIIASLAMAITLAISCYAIQERDPRLEGEPGKEKGGVVAFFVGLYRSMQKLPPQIQKVCMVQFFAWIAWFPFLFYITTYIGELYVEPFFEENPNMSPTEIDQTWEHATRVGTFALLIFAVTTFSSSVILPFVVASSYKAPEPAPVTPMTPGARTPGTPLTPHTAGASSAAGYFGYNPAHTDDWSTKPEYQDRNAFQRFCYRLPSLEIRWLTLRRAWMLSHVVFALLMWLTFLVRDTTTATVLVGLIGIPWAMTNWAPFALIAAEISTRDSIRRGHIRAPPTREGELLASGEDEGADQAGVVLGIHNVAIAAPQVIATLVSSAIFKALQKPRGSVGDDSVAWVLRFGGCAALVAAWYTRKVGEGD